MTVDIYQAVAEVEKNNETAALCTVVKSEGSTPRHVGSKMLVYPDGTVHRHGRRRGSGASCAG